MKLLVTGGAGFIGSNFIHYWLTKHPDDSIVNLDALTYAGSLDNLAGLENNPRYTFIHGDICDRETVMAATENVDAIVHFAAESHVDNSIRDSAPFIRTNVVGTQVLLEAARERDNLRFHHISTDEVFGSLGPDDAPFNERTPYSPRSPYSASKASSDHLVRAYYHTHGLPVTISNCSNNYGPRQHAEKFIPTCIARIANNKKIPLYGTGENVRDWLHVDDHCRAIDCILQRGQIGETYCVGGNSERSNRDVIRTLLRLTGKTEELIEHVPDRKGHDFRYAIDATKMKKALGWQPEIPFEEGLQQTIAWYATKK